MNRKTAATVVTGAFLVLAGVLVLGQLAGLWNLTFALNGWWTLFLILPAIAGIIASGPRLGNISLLLLGIWLFLDSQGWLGQKGWAVLVGLFLILMGVRTLTGWGRDPDGHYHHHHHHNHDGEPDDQPVGPK